MVQLRLRDTKVMPKNRSGAMPHVGRFFKREVQSSHFLSLLPQRYSCGSHASTILLVRAMLADPIDSATPVWLDHFDGSVRRTRRTPQDLASEPRGPQFIQL